MNIKNNQKGFIVQGIMAIVALVLIGGSAYYAGTKNLTTPIIDTPIEEIKLISATSTLQSKEPNTIKDENVTPIKSVTPSKADSSVLPNATIGVRYYQVLDLGNPSLKTRDWQIVSGSLPPGLYLNDEELICTTDEPQSTCSIKKASISGTAKKEGAYSFVLRVLDEKQTIDKGYTISVKSPSAK